jgi:lysozyme
MSNTPPSPPRLSRADIKARITLTHPGRTLPAFFICGIRGYYRDSMGAVGRNDRGVYDDALFIVSPEAFAGFNGNTDPSVSRRRIATLKPGWWECYQFDTHNGSAPHPAICQRKGPVTVARDGAGLDTGMFGINIHRGGRTTTSSLGCQTLPPAQWDAFYALAKAEAQRVYGARWNKETITYILLG